MLVYEFMWCKCLGRKVRIVSRGFFDTSLRVQPAPSDSDPHPAITEVFLDDLEELNATTH